MLCYKNVANDKICCGTLWQCYCGMLPLCEIVRHDLWYVTQTKYDKVWHATLYYLMLCYLTLCYLMLWYLMLCYAILCCAILCYDILCHTILCHVIMCYDMLCMLIMIYDMFGHEHEDRNFHVLGKTNFIFCVSDLFWISVALA